MGILLRPRKPVAPRRGCWRAACRLQRRSMTIPVTERTVLALRLADEAATADLAWRLAGLARRGDVIALSGDLGAGKTRFARSFIAALQPTAEEVPSPTFTLVQTYDTRSGSVWHFDLYRVNRPEEAWELDIEEAFAEGIALVEWPERLGGLLPRRSLTVSLGFVASQPGARTAQLDGAGDWPARLAAEFADG